MEELMEKVREWLKTQTVVSHTSIQRKFQVQFGFAATAVAFLQDEGLVAIDWDKAKGGYPVLGKAS